MSTRGYAIAPMMAYTDRHYRWLMRAYCPGVYLYTEMITSAAICFGDVVQHLQFSSEESPVALQLGGSDPEQLSRACKLAAEFKYSEINLNVGCPSKRVQSGSFGACLLKQPDLVAKCVAAMRHTSCLPITVKTRIGVDDVDSYAHLQNFIATVHAAGCNTFIIHARKAWLEGLSPAQNRSVPPLDYSVVYQLKQDFPDLEIIINGGIKSVADVREHLQHVDGVMIGRAAYHDPGFIVDIASLFGHKTNKLDNVLEQYVTYCEKALKSGARWATLLRHLFGFYHGKPGAKQWRRGLSQLIAGDADAGLLGLFLQEFGLRYDII